MEEVIKILRFKHTYSVVISFASHDSFLMDGCMIILRKVSWKNVYLLLVVVYLVHSLQRLYGADLKLGLRSIVPYLLQGSKTILKVELLLEGFPTDLHDTE